MSHGYCPACGEQQTRHHRWCRTCCFETDANDHPLLYDHSGTPDYWDDNGIPGERWPDQEGDNWPYL